MSGGGASGAALGAAGEREHALFYDVPNEDLSRCSLDSQPSDMQKCWQRSVTAGNTGEVHFSRLLRRALGPVPRAPRSSSNRAVSGYSNSVRRDAARWKLTLLLLFRTFCERGSVACVLLAASQCMHHGVVEYPMANAKSSMTERGEHSHDDPGMAEVNSPLQMMSS